MTRRRRPVALWSPAMVASLREAARDLSPARQVAPWESGFVRLRQTVRRVTCASCGKAIPKQTEALHAHSGDGRKTPHSRFIHLQPCDPAPFPQSQGDDSAPAVETLAALGAEHPERLTPAEIREVCEAAAAGRTA